MASKTIWSISSQGVVVQRVNDPSYGSDQLCLLYRGQDIITHDMKDITFQ